MLFFFRKHFIPLSVAAAIMHILAHAATAQQTAITEQTASWRTIQLFIGVALGVLIVAISIITARRENKRASVLATALQEQTEIFNAVAANMKDAAAFLLDPFGKIRHWNFGAVRLFGYAEQDIIGRPYASLFAAEDTKTEKPNSGIKIAGTEGKYEATAWFLRKNGGAFHAHMLLLKIGSASGKQHGFIAIIHDLTEMKQAEELLKKLSLSVEQSADLVLIADKNGRVEYVNKAVEDVTGCTREEFFAKGMEILRSEHHDEKIYKEMWNTVLSGFSFQAEVIIHRRNGDQIVLDEVVTPITDAHGNVTHALITAADITPLKTMKEKLSYLTSFDDITGLPNRSLFTERLNRDRSRASKGSGTIAVLAIDIDRFKFINEIYGLDAGNKVLKQVAESLSVSVNKTDTVARLGSDEFGIILHDIRKPSDVILFVKMIMKNVPQIIMSGGEEISVTLAVGIALFPDDGKDAHTLMKNADIALAKAKSLGRNNYQFYTPDMNVGVSELVFMERRLADALRNQEYTLSYQPYCYLSSGRVCGLEALLKWKNEEFGMVSPVKFIPMLEETGMIIDVGKWVLRTACKQIREWQNSKSPLPVAVNLSLSQFRNEHLADTVAAAVKESRINPRSLTLEITESIFVKDLSFTISVLQKLKEIGISISIDDFGTGYSSLSYLKKFPVDYVKIDQSFIKDVAIDPDATSLVSSIISMAHSLSLKTIAEGVETEDQWKILRLLKCDMAQGYYFSPAVSPKEIERFFEA